MMGRMTSLFLLFGWLCWGAVGCDEAKTPSVAMSSGGTTTGGASQTGGMAPVAGSLTKAGTPSMTGGIITPAGMPTAGESPSGGGLTAAGEAAAMGGMNSGGSMTNSDTGGIASGGRADPGGELTGGAGSGGAIMAGTPIVPAGGIPAIGGGAPAGGSIALPQAQEQQPPEWPRGSSMYAERVDPRAVQLAWSHAIDNIGVETYLVYQADIIVARVPVRQNNYAVSGLLEGAQYTFGVVAEDAAGNRSNMLVLTLQTQDRNPPIWADNALLRAVDVMESSATLTWAAAQDNVSVARYRLLLNDRIVLETAATTARLDMLSPLTDYRAQVIAIDGSNNPSVNNPTIQFTTIDSLRINSQNLGRDIA